MVANIVRVREGIERQRVARLEVEVVFGSATEILKQAFDHQLVVSDGEMEEL